MREMIIAIDGPAASGKGTIGQRLAERLGLAFLDTGLLYRAATKRILARGVSPSDVVSITESIRDLTVQDIIDDGLRSPEVSSTAPLIASIPEVREILSHIQRNFAHNPPAGKLGSVLDGRDIGTTICPNADIKIFITASLEARAGRRYKELTSNGVQISLEKVHQDLEQRDKQDLTRSVSPLRAAHDAVVIDTTDLSPDEALEAALTVVLRRKEIGCRYTQTGT
jgi:CMP/dCMP kinase